MSIANPLTASNAIARAIPSTISPQSKPKTVKPDLGVFAKDVLEISKEGLKKQQNEAQLNASKEINDIASDVVRVSSSIGRAKSLGSLTTEQAASLYQKISSLL